MNSANDHHIESDRQRLESIWQALVNLIQEQVQGTIPLSVQESDLNQQASDISPRQQQYQLQQVLKGADVPCILPFNVCHEVDFVASATKVCTQALTASYGQPESDETIPIPEMIYQKHGAGKPRSFRTGMRLAP